MFCLGLYVSMLCLSSMCAGSSDYVFVGIMSVFVCMCMHACVCMSLFICFSISFSVWIYISHCVPLYVRISVNFVFVPLPGKPACTSGPSVYLFAPLCPVNIYVHFCAKCICMRTSVPGVYVCALLCQVYIYAHLCARWHLYSTEVLSCQTRSLVPATSAHRKDLIEKISSLQPAGTSEMESVHAAARLRRCQLFPPCGDGKGRHVTEHVEPLSAECSHYTLRVI